MNVYLCARVLVLLTLLLRDGLMNVTSFKVSKILFGPRTNWILLILRLYKTFRNIERNFSLEVVYTL